VFRIGDVITKKGKKAVLGMVSRGLTAIFFSVESLKKMSPSVVVACLCVNKHKDSPPPPHSRSYASLRFKQIVCFLTCSFFITYVLMLTVEGNRTPKTHFFLSAETLVRRLK
jgi:hypothetical protein